MSNGIRKQRGQGRSSAEVPATGGKVGQKLKLKVNLIIQNQWLKAGTLVDGSALPEHLRKARFVEPVSVAREEEGQ